MLLIASAIWIAIFRLEQWVSLQQGRFDLASTLNAAFVAVLGIIIAITPDMSEADIRKWNFVPVAYYITDFARTSNDMRVHHIATMAIYQWTPFVPEFVAALMMLDIPIPILNFALWWRRRSVVPAWLKMLVAVSYFVPRLVWYPLQLGRASAAIMDVHPLMILPYVLLVLLNAWWFTLIVRK
jgi:hypothetical protein